MGVLLQHKGDRSYLIINDQFRLGFSLLSMSRLVTQTYMPKACKAGSYHKSVQTVEEGIRLCFGVTFLFCYCDWQRLWAGGDDRAWWRLRLTGDVCRHKQIRLSVITGSGGTDFFSFSYFSGYSWFLGKSPQILKYWLFFKKHRQIKPQTRCSSWAITLWASVGPPLPSPHHGLPSGGPGSPVWLSRLCTSSGYRPKKGPFLPPASKICTMNFNSFPAEGSNMSDSNRIS